MIEIVEVTSRQQYRAFFQFPFDLYRNCPQWVPTITKEEMDRALAILDETIGEVEAGIKY